MLLRQLDVSRRRFIVLAAFAAVPSLFVGQVPARAASSGNVPMYINGECYYNISEVNVSGNYVSSVATIKASRTLPAGWLGAYSVLYNANGAALSSRMAYSASASVGFGVGTSAVKTTGVSYRGLAYTYVYNQSTGGYYESGAVWSPYQTANSLEGPYRYNDQGQSYGPIDGVLTAGYYPDLIAVKGISGVEGYAYKDELLCAAPTSLEEAIAYYSQSGSFGISVYASDGVTWLDTYEIQVGGGAAN